MQLQGPDLIIETRGDDVALLHRELIQLGFQIPREEAEKLFYGPATRQIVLEFQSRYPNEDLASGVVDQRTAELTLSLHKFRLSGDLRQLARPGGSATTPPGPPDWPTY